MLWWIAASLEGAVAGGFQAGEVVEVAADEVVDDDVYLVGREVRVAGRVTGDVYAAAERIEVDGVVEGDLVAAGRAVVVRGEVGDDVRVAGATLKVEPAALIGDDLIGAGFGMRVAPEGRVGGDAAFAGYELLLDGDVGRDLRVAAGALRITGEVGGDVDVDLRYTEDDVGAFGMSPMSDLPVIQPGLEIDDDAVIGGDLTYRAPAAGDVEGAVAGATDYRSVPYEDVSDPAGWWGMHALRRFLALLLVGLLGVAVLPDLTARVGTIARTHPLASLGRGLLGLIVAGLLVVVVAIGTLVLAALLGVATLGGLSGAVVLTGLFTETTLVTTTVLLVSWIAPIPILLLVGDELWSRFGGDRRPGRGWVLLSALVLYGALLLVPFLGWLVEVLVALTGLGATLALAAEELGLGRARPT